jgi:GH43 family beta-xylosidase
MKQLLFKKTASYLLILCLFTGLNGQSGRSQSDRTYTSPTFTNPLLPSGADPWSIYKDGFYYYMQTTNENLTIWKTRDLTDLKNAETKIVWTPPGGRPYSKQIWAPELHFLRGKWYIYFAADDGRNANHRLWVLENGAADPLQGVWVMKGKLSDPSDKWAIDGSVFEHRGKLYLIWSGWEGDENGEQNIYIARLRNPWTVAGRRVRISSPQYPWERVGDLDTSNNSSDPPHVDVNEGPQILMRGEKIFLIYSASGCWKDNYSLGMLRASANSNLLQRRSWLKSKQPVFRQSPEARAYGTGHNAFFKSPDGKEDWILYHANAEPAQGCGRGRSPRAQRFTWKADGTPDFGRPVPVGMPIQRPTAR